MILINSSLSLPVFEETSNNQKLLVTQKRNASLTNNSQSNTQSKSATSASVFTTDRQSLANSSPSGQACTLGSHLMKECIDSQSKTKTPHNENVPSTKRTPTTRKLDPSITVLIEDRRGRSREVGTTKKRKDKIDFSNMFREEIENYPEDEIKLALNQTSEEIKNLFNIINTPLDPNVNLTERIAHHHGDEDYGNGAKEESICSSVSRNIYPREVNRYNSLVYVPNTQEFMQVIQAEICQYPDQECSYLQDSLPYGMVSSCVQKYSYKKLLYFDPLERRMATDMFRFPSCCSCYIKSLSIDLRSSSGSNSSSLPKQQIRSKPNQTELYSSNLPQDDAPTIEPLLLSNDNSPIITNKKLYEYSSSNATNQGSMSSNQADTILPSRRAKSSQIFASSGQTDIAKPERRAPAGEEHPTGRATNFSNRNKTADVPLDSVHTSSNHTLVLHEDKVYTSSGDNK